VGSFAWAAKKNAGKARGFLLAARHPRKRKTKGPQKDARGKGKEGLGKKEEGVQEPDQKTERRSGIGKKEKQENQKVTKTLGNAKDTA